MAWTPPVRNFDRVQFADLRKKVDPMINELHDSLTRAYYDYWRHGQSCPWQSFDVQATPKESKVLFDTLHGLIFEHHTRVFHEENQALPAKDRIPEEKYNEIRDETGALVGTRSDEAATKIAALKAEGIEITVPDISRER